ncbi:Altered inheritance of mitochondria protein 18 mitochondrial [Arthrobotrys musiformis]|uniref:Altered inheritance of mitochondria protein 18 mitochondrial n=1 Tax=Arthrobotrys musiformis TaxID=47236 RepID=A0AAV9W204_9PEZI
MSSALRCHQLQRQILSCERRLLIHSFRPHCPANRPPTALSRLQHPRHASTKNHNANTPPKKQPPKYPPIKPDPHKIWLREQAHLANPRPTFDPKGKYKFKLTGETLYQKQRRVDKQVAVALFLFVGIIVVTQIWLPRNPKLPGGYKLDNQSSTSDSDKKKFEDAVKGGKVVIKEATNVGETVETVPSGTKSVSPLPKQIYLPAGPQDHNSDNQVLEEYTLLGHGIRTVSFLGIQVYVMAFYVATSSLPTLQHHLLHSLDIPSTATTATLPEQEALKSKLLSDEGSIEFFSALLDTRDGNGVKTAIRVVPTRSTDYPHLRDGWVRGIQGKTTLHPDVYDDDAFVEALGRFKAIFGGRKAVPKGRALILLRDQNGALFTYGPDEAVKDKELKLLSEGAKKKESMHGLKMLGVMDDPRIARALWLCYFAGKKVASEGARTSVVDGLVEVVGRPVGSTEGKVV